MSSTRLTWPIAAFLAASAAVYLLTSAAYTVAGQVHVDEGAYLYAANRVMAGDLPYRDFFYLQAPLHPYIYGPVQRVFGARLTTGRLTSAAFGLLANLLAVYVAWRLKPGWTAATAAAGLIAWNSYQTYFFTITRLYALTGFWLSLGAALLVWDRVGERWRETGAAICLGLAIATRLTVLPALMAYGLVLAVKHRRRLWRWLAPPMAGAAVAAAIFLPFYLAAHDQLYFNILGLNLSLHSRNLLANITQKARSLAHLVRNLWFPLTCLALAAAFRSGDWRGWRPVRWRPGPEAMVWSWIAAITAGHLAAKIFQESYQSFLYPLFAALIAVELARAADRAAAPAGMRRTMHLTFCSGCLLMLLAYGRQSLSHVGGQLPTRILADQAALVRSVTGPGDELFSADTALIAVEAGRDLLPGMAGSDYFPDWTTGQCQQYRVTNDEILAEYLTSRRAKVLVASGLSFTLSLPLLEPVPEERRLRLFQLIEENYSLLREYPNIMVPGTVTRIYLRR